MFAGEFRHTIDAKNRLVVPNKFRVFITDEADRKGFFVVAGIAHDRCIRLYTLSAWKKVMEKVRRDADKKQDPSQHIRYFASRGEFSPIDAQHRLVIPQKLLNYAGIKKDVLMVGTMDWIEVWSESDYHAATENLDEEMGDLRRALWPDVS